MGKVFVGVGVLGRNVFVFVVWMVLVMFIMVMWIVELGYVCMYVGVLLFVS